MILSESFIFSTFVRISKIAYADRLKRFFQWANLHRNLVQQRLGRRLRPRIQQKRRDNHHARQTAKG